MDHKQQLSIATQLDSAEQEQRELVRFSKENPDTTVSEAYEIQELLLNQIILPL